MACKLQAIFLGQKHENREYIVNMAQILICVAHLCYNT